MMQFFKNLFLSRYFFIILIIIVLLFVVAYIFPVFFFIPQLLLLAFVLVFLTDIIVLFNVKKGIEVKRYVADKLSMGDENKIVLSVKNFYRFPINVEVIDEVPIQFQIRDTQFEAEINPLEDKKIAYTLRPVKRGDNWLNAAFALKPTAKFQCIHPLYKCINMS